MRNPAGPFPWRRAVQAGFLLLCTWIGVEFHLFIRGAQGLGPARAHPPGAEGFLPISALISLKYWIASGKVCELHPAGLFIFVAVLAIGLLLKKAFCSWLCPVGTLSEGLWMLGRRLSGRNFDLPRWADQYLLLLFFLWAALRLDGPMLEAFLYSPFNAAADLRMYAFFAQLSGTALGVLLVLAALSLVVRNFWCRYLCPYGALLGALSLLSPLRITRNKATCIDCKLCTKACPSRIQVHQAGRVASDECTGCYRCVEVCPVKDTLGMKAPWGRAVPAWVFGALAVAVFLGVTGAAKLAGQWRNVITQEDYRLLLRMEAPGGR
jgi:polyferredoxin